MDLFDGMLMMVTVIHAMIVMVLVVVETWDESDSDADDHRIYTDKGSGVDDNERDRDNAGMCVLKC